MEENKNESMGSMDSKSDTSSQSMQSSSASPKSDKAPEPTWLFYALSIIIPIAGIILGIIYMTKDSQEQKKFGKTALTLGIIFALIPCICYIVYVVFIIGLASTGAGDVSYTTY